MIWIRIIQRCYVQSGTGTVALVWQQKDKFVQLLVDPQNFICADGVHKGYGVDVRPDLAVASVEVYG